MGILIALVLVAGTVACLVMALRYYGKGNPERTINWTVGTAISAMPTVGMVVAVSMDSTGYGLGAGAATMLLAFFVLTTFRANIETGARSRHRAAHVAAPLAAAQVAASPEPPKNEPYVPGRIKTGATGADSGPTRKNPG